MRFALATQTTLETDSHTRYDGKSGTIKGRGRPKKKPRELKALNELTVEYAEKLTNKELHHYTVQLAGKKPNQRPVSLEIVLDHIKKQD